MNFESIIGLEIHIGLNTKSKMFSSAQNSHNSEPNTSTALLDLAYPGVLPTVNKEAVKKAIRLCKALHMEIDDTLYFDRKNYFYADLPKGFQITQYYRPIGKNGFLTIEVNGKNEKIEIERLHLEEDTCKQLHFDDYTLLDYNRNGIPLIEIVTKPVLRSGLSAKKFIEKLREIVIFADISDGKMEDGSLRCDTNISIRPYGCKTFGPKVEIKNLNSINDIEWSLDFESKRQSRMLLSGNKIIQETRRFDEAKKQTLSMRAKTEEVDYKYFPESNIPPIKLTKEFIQEAIGSCPELYDEIYERYVDVFKIKKVDAKILLSNIMLSKYFDLCAKHVRNYQFLANLFITNLLAYFNKENKDISEFDVNPEYIADIVNLLDEKKINSSQQKSLFEKVIKENKSPNIFTQELGENLICDEEEINKMIDDVIASFPNLVEDYKNGKDRAKSFIVGQLMKKTGGKIDPVVASDLAIKALTK